MKVILLVILLVRCAQCSQEEEKKITMSSSNASDPIENLIHDNKTINLIKEKLHRNDEFIHELLKNYDSQVPPVVTPDEPLDIQVALKVLEIDSISATNMEFRLDVFLRQFWKDPRLVFNRTANGQDSINFNFNTIKRLWVPDLYFPNEKTSRMHDITMPNIMFHLKNDGSVFYSIRLALVLSCPMSLETFPLDSQICGVDVESFNHPRNLMRLHWKDESTGMKIPSGGLDLAQYTLLKAKTMNIISEYGKGGMHCSFEKPITSHQHPRLSWVGFWISVDAVPARVSLGIITVLTICTQISSSRLSHPKVSYLKAIDIWMTTCLLFVFAAFLEFAIVNIVWRQEVRKNIRRGSEAAHMHTSGAKAVDKTSRMFFPVTFAIFVLCYWVVYSFMAYRDQEELAAN